MLRWWIVCAALLAMQPAMADARVKVAVSIAPQAWLVRQIGDKQVDVLTVLRAGSNAATFSPPPSVLRELGRRAVYFSIGVPFEQAWLPALHKAWPALRILSLDQGLERLKGAAHVAHTHDFDPHVWTRVANLRQMAQRVRDELIQLDPDSRSRYARRWKALDLRLRHLDDALRARLLPYRGRAFMVFHPAWGYFAHEYGLRQVVIEPFGKQVGPRRLMRLIEQARREHIAAVFVQPQFSERQARLIARAIGGKVVRLDPLAYDIEHTLRAAADAFAREAAE